LAASREPKSSPVRLPTLEPYLCVSSWSLLSLEQRCSWQSRITQHFRHSNAFKLRGQPSSIRIVRSYVSASDSTNHGCTTTSPSTRPTTTDDAYSSFDFSSTAVSGSRPGGLQTSTNADLLLSTTFGHSTTVSISLLIWSLTSSVQSSECGSNVWTASDVSGDWWTYATSLSSSRAISAVQSTTIPSISCARSCSL